MLQWNLFFFLWFSVVFLCRSRKCSKNIFAHFPFLFIVVLHYDRLSLNSLYKQSTLFASTFFLAVAPHSRRSFIDLWPDKQEPLKPLAYTHTQARKLTLGARRRKNEKQNWIEWQRCRCVPNDILHACHSVRYTKYNNTHFLSPKRPQRERDVAKAAIVSTKCPKTPIFPQVKNNIKTNSKLAGSA